MRADPFGSLAGVRGATFHRCDVLAARLNKAPDDEGRLAAAMLHVLNASVTHDGHVFLSWRQLCEGVGRLLGPRHFAALSEGALEEAATTLHRRGAVARVPIGGSGGGEVSTRTAEGDEDRGGGREWDSSAVFLGVLNDAEVEIAADIARRLKQPRREHDVHRMHRWIEVAAAKEGWRPLSPAQEAFLDLALCEPICVLTGGPGTGKTFATHVAIRLWRVQERKILMCAPTGRAAQRLADSVSAGRRMSDPVQCSTIHRLLEMRRGGRGDEDDDGVDVDADDASDNSLSYKGKFSRDAKNPLDADVVIVDETSMLDLPLCAALLDAIKPDAQVVFIGDADQLPSVGPGSVLGDILASCAVPSVQLRDVFRQAETSGIIRAAYDINEGLLPTVPTKRWDPTLRALAAELEPRRRVAPVTPVSPGQSHRVSHTGVSGSVRSVPLGQSGVATDTVAGLGGAGFADGGGVGPGLDGYGGGGSGWSGLAVEDEDEMSFVAPIAPRAGPEETHDLEPEPLGGGGAAGGGGGGGRGELQYSNETWEGADCVWVTLPDDSPAGYEDALEALFDGALPALQGIDPAIDLQVLTPFRRGPASTSQLNAFLQARLNPPGDGRLEARAGDVTLREGDRVLQRSNDYNKEVFNGELGTIVAVENDGGVRVVFGVGGLGLADAKRGGGGDTIARALESLSSGGREIEYSRSELNNLIPAWALTVHKAQGCEYRAVVLCLAVNHRPLLRRELVYTAASRAKEVLVILSPGPALEAAVTAVGNRRNTTLARRLALLAPRASSYPAEAAVAAAIDRAARRAAAEADENGGSFPETSSS